MFVYKVKMDVIMIVEDVVMVLLKIVEFKLMFVNLSFFNEKVLMIVGVGNDNVYLFVRNL